MKIKNNTNNNSFNKRSLKLKGEIVENILLLLRLKEYSVSDLLFEIKRKSPLTSYKTLKNYLVYLTDYELISYNGQRKVYLIECNGVDLLYWINKEK
jgi:hypothetical protein